MSLHITPAKAEKSEGAGGTRQVCQATGRGARRAAGRAWVGRRLGADRARVAGQGAQARILSILFADVPGAGRARYTAPPPPESGGLLSRNLSVPHSDILSYSDILPTGSMYE